MLIFNEERLSELNSVSSDNLYILTDFDGTITKDNSDSSWASIFKNPIVSKQFIEECIRIFNYYHKFEIDESLSTKEKMAIMNEWYRKNIETLTKFSITEETINYAANNDNIITFRKGAIDFLKTMYNKNIPIIVISAGVGNIIEQFLIKNNCNYPNIYICSNFLEYENGIVKSVRDNNLIHPLNKNEVFLPENIKSKIENRSNILLLGNSVSDIKMAKNNKKVFKLGFLDENIEERLQSFKDNYDIICTNNTGYDEIKKKVKILN